jgi:hypothetical protein
VAALSCWLGLSNWRRTDRLWSRRAVFDLSACSRLDGSWHDKPVYITRLGSCGSARSDGTPALDGVLHLMGNRLGRMGRGPKQRTEAAYGRSIEGSMSIVLVIGATSTQGGAVADQVLERGHQVIAYVRVKIRGMTHLYGRTI